MAASQWTQTFVFFFIGLVLLLAFFETKLPDFVGMNSAKHARRASHIRSHQLSLMNKMEIDPLAPTQPEKTVAEARKMGISGLGSVDKEKRGGNMYAKVVEASESLNSSATT